MLGVANVYWAIGPMDSFVVVNLIVFCCEWVDVWSKVLALMYGKH